MGADFFEAGRLRSDERVPPARRLPIPGDRAKHKRVELTEHHWAARLNPLTTPPERTLKAWEGAYNEALQKAQAELDSSKENKE